MLAVSFWTASQSYAGTTVSSKTLYGSTGWSQLQLEATAPAGAAFVRVEFGPGR
jgi:hypothetical protein